MVADFPIDIVYLWVDGNDDAWQAKRLGAARKLSACSLGGMAPFANVAGRFRDNEELRYNLRALETFFPQHGHIYIVTDGQLPKWLQPTAGLTVIDHRELIPAACLPTFDSGNIESYIHRIPGLSERYFYLNDDVFFGAPVHVNEWFWSSGVYVAWSDDAVVTDEAMDPTATSLINASRLSAQWLKAHAKRPIEKAQWEMHVASEYQHTFRTFAHSPRPMLRSLLYELEARAPELFANVRSTVFRAWDKPTIVSDFVLRWALAHGVAKVREYSHLHIATGDADSCLKLVQLAACRASIDFFCINDTTDDAPMLDHRLTQARGALQGMFVAPSRYEISAAPHLNFAKNEPPREQLTLLDMDTTV